MPPLPPHKSMLTKIAVSTAKGAAITLGSTVASCVLAMYIEAGAHRLVYRYFPHKYAHVDCAFGLTRDQLEAVRETDPTNLSIISAEPTTMSLHSSNDEDGTTTQFYRNHLNDTYQQQHHPTLHPNTTSQQQMESNTARQHIHIITSSMTG